MAGDFTYTLMHPVQFGSELVTEITIKRPKGKHFRKMRSLGGDISVSDLLDLIASLAGKAPPFMDEVDLEDIAALGERLADFFPSLRTTSTP